jgi:hypothetical protein
MSKVLNLSLTDARYSLLAEIADSNGVTVYTIVREAIDLYLFGPWYEGVKNDEGTGLRPDKR